MAALLPLACAFVGIGVARASVWSRIPVPGWQDRLGSIAFEAACVCLAALSSRAGGVVAWAGRAVVVAILGAQFAGVAFFDTFGTYPPGYVVRALTVDELSTSFAAILEPRTWPGVLALLLVGIGFGRAGSLELAGGRKGLAAWSIAFVWASVAAVQSVRHQARAPVTAQSPIAKFGTEWTPPGSVAEAPEGVATPVDWAPSGELDPRWSSLGAPASDVILVVLESMRAKDAFPVVPSQTPRLSALGKDAAVFTRAYAHDPRSIKSLEALLFGVFPAPAWEATSWSHPDLALEGLPSRWKSAGLATAFFEDSDPAFDQYGKLLQALPFDVVQDKRQLRNLVPGGGDASLVLAFDRFLDAQAGKRVGAVLWPMRSHHPYVVPGGTAAPESHDAYVEAVRHVDSVLGGIVDSLEKHGRSGTSAILVTGDHGESFGEHPESGLAHGRWLFEESIRVPFVVSWPGRFHGEQVPDVVQLKDVAATAAWLADGKSPDLNLGRSVFHARPTHAAYAVGRLDGLRVALVDGDRKFHFSRNSQGIEDFRVFDLAADPDERTNLWNASDPSHAALAARAFGWVHLWDVRWQQAWTAGLHRDRAWMEKRFGGVFVE